MLSRSLSSQASPRPLRFQSACPGLATAGQLSTLLATLSPSRSGSQAVAQRVAIAVVLAGVPDQGAVVGGCGDAVLVGVGLCVVVDAVAVQVGEPNPHGGIGAPDSADVGGAEFPAALADLRLADGRIPRLHESGVGGQPVGQHAVEKLPGPRRADGGNVIVVELTALDQQVRHLVVDAAVRVDCAIVVELERYDDGAGRRPMPSPLRAPSM
jgi:hypothetical protein